MAAGNVELLHERSPNTRAWEQQERNKIKKQTKEARREARVRKKSKAGAKEEKSPDGPIPSQPQHNNRNILQKWKKSNEIQIDNENKCSKKSTSHPPSSAS